MMEHFYPGFEVYHTPYITLTGSITVHNQSRETQYAPDLDIPSIDLFAFKVMNNSIRTPNTDFFYYVLIYSNQTPSAACLASTRCMLADIQQFNWWKNYGK
jgi:hypothetical protein